MKVAPQQFNKSGNLFTADPKHDEEVLFIRNRMEEHGQYLKFILFAQRYDLVKDAYSVLDGNAEEYAPAVGPNLGNVR